MNNPVSVGVVGTSWWADSMYLPALIDHPLGHVAAICGRDPDNARQIAGRWNIPHVYTDYRRMIESGRLQALIVASRNDSHYPIAMRALQAGLHVLCEKPLALTYQEAAEMAALADAQGIVHMVPFTYRYMPTARYIKELLEDGYIGQPYHLNMRYYTGYGRTSDYSWRFDVAKAGSGAIGDIGSHFLYLAQWYFGDIVGLSSQFGRLVDRAPLDPEGRSYEVAEDTAIVTFTFANGAQGVIHATTLAYEDTPFGQTHHMEFHGSEGTLYHFIDWDRVQRVSGARQGEGPVKELQVPERIWGNVRRDTVHNTYRDIFRRQEFMTREFVTAVAERKPLRPDFHDGASVQRLLDAAVLSDKERRWVAVDSIAG
jgi:predicted dehydrogenase